jgi:hypothetical protein
MKKAFSISSPSSLEGLSPFSPLSLALRFPEALAGSRPGRLVLSFRQFDALPFSGANRGAAELSKSARLTSIFRARLLLCARVKPSVAGLAS